MIEITILKIENLMWMTISKLLIYTLVLSRVFCNLIFKKDKRQLREDFYLLSLCSMRRLIG